MAAPNRAETSGSKSGSAAERILKELRKVFQHDLPNQMVVFHGLVQLLELDEKDNLGPQAHEYLKRMKSVSEKTLNLGRCVKELSHLLDKPEEIESILLPGLLQELKAQTRHLFPDNHLEWDSAFDLAHIPGARHTLLRGLLELLRLSFSLTNARHFRIFLRTRAEGSRRLLQLEILPTDPAQEPLPRDPKSWETRLEFFLARELLASAGSELRLGPSTHGANSQRMNFILGIPG